MKNTIFNKSSLLAVSVALCLTAHAQNYSQVVVFGDSLSDTGNLAKQINDNPVVSAFVGAAHNSFTTNPDTTWADVFASAYGLSAMPNNNGALTGTNYAVGGAKSQNNDTMAFGMISIPSVRQQVDYHLNANNQKADPNALYVVWVGANDLFEASKKSSALEVLTDIRTASLGQVADINRLHEAGATKILVPNLPDVGVTPRSVANPSTAQQATLASTIYNNTLFSQLNTSNANVIPANTFALLQEAVAHKEAFGFSNVSEGACKNINAITSSLGCGEGNWQATGANANNTHAFADDIHPSGRTHRILAQYYRSIIDTPAYVGKLPHELLKAGAVNDRHLYRRLDNLSGAHGVWADIHASDDTKPVVQAGFDVVGASSHTGAYISHQKQRHDLHNTLSAHTKNVGMGLYHRHQLGNIHLKGVVGMERLSVDTHRKIAWEGEARTHTADTSARRLYGGVQVGYGVPVGKAQIRPVLGVHTQKIKVRDLTESSPNLSTAMRFGKQTQKSLQGEIGVDVDYPVSPNMTVSGGISHAHEFKDDTHLINASLTSMSEYTKGFHTKIQTDKAHATTAHVGIKTLLGKANIHAGIHATHQDGDTDVGGTLGVGVAF